MAMERNGTIAKSDPCWLEIWNSTQNLTWIPIFIYYTDLFGKLG